MQGKISETDLRMLKGLSRSWVLEQDPYKQIATTDTLAVGEKAVAANDAVSQGSKRSKKSSNKSSQAKTPSSSH